MTAAALREKPASTAASLREKPASYRAPEGAAAPILRRGDLVEAGAVPPVVCPQDVEELMARLRESSDSSTPAGWIDSDLEAQVANYVRDYYADEAENRRALSTVLTSLAGDRGRGFFLNGLYGAGKSHFLAVAALLAGFPAAWRLFLETHPEYRATAQACRAQGPLLVVMVPLEAHRGRLEDLEEILFAGAEKALAAFEQGRDSHLSSASFALQTARERLFPVYEEAFRAWLMRRLKERLEEPVSWEDLCAGDEGAAAGLAAEFAREVGVPLEWQEPRRERLHRLLEIARRCGCRGVLALLDEVSLFLGSKPRDRFCTDVSFLQFLGQQSAYYPLWIVGAVQRGVEEIGSIDADTFRKLKDRYVWDLTLSLAQLRPVIGQKLVRKKDPAAFREFIQALRIEQSAGAAPGWDPEEMADIYPLHPTTLECLAEASNRFFSKTRSVVQFVLRAVQEGKDRPANELVSLDEVLDQFWPAVSENPELRPTYQACAYYRQEIGAIYPADPVYALRLAKALAALSIAGLRKSAAELCAAVPSATPGTYPERLARTHSILEVLRCAGGYVDVSRGETPGSDVYFFDPGYDLSRTIRRRLTACLACLEEGDPRILASAYAAASDAGLPLAALDRPCRVSVEWMGVEHEIAVQRVDLERWGPEAAASEMEWLADDRQPETLRILVAELDEPAVQKNHFQETLRKLPADRWRAGLVGWIPRALSEAEQQTLREYAAFCLLQEDPTLRSHGYGRQVLARIRQDRPARDAEVRKIVRSAYAGGELAAAGQTLATGRDLGAHASRLAGIAGLAAARALPGIFPDFAAIAPRRPLAGRAAILPLLHELVLPGSAPIEKGSPLDGLIRDIALPLGIAHVSDGRYVLSEPAPLLDIVFSSIPEDESVPWAIAAGRLAKSRSGLSPEQIDLVLAALVRRGLLAACGPAGTPIPLSPGCLPLSAHVRSLRRGDALAAGLSSRIETLARSIELPAVPAGPSGPHRAADLQERLWHRLRDLKSSGQTTLLREGLSILIEELASSPDRWTGSFAALDQWQKCVEQIGEDASPCAGLGRLLETPPDGVEEQLAPIYRGWRLLQTFILEEGPRLARALRLIRHPLFAVPPGSDLAARRDQLERLVGEGDALVSRGAEAALYAEALLERYRDYYLEWHTTTFGEARFAPYRRVSGVPGWRSLEQLASLGTSSWLDGLRTLVETQLGLQCSSAGLRTALLRQPVCPACRLPAGSTIELTPLSAIEARLEEGLRDSLEKLAGRLPRLRRHLESRLAVTSPVRAGFGELIRMLEEVGAGRLARFERAAMDGLLEDPLIREVRLALLAGEPSVRQLSILRGMLEGREMARAEALRAFGSWLDPEGKLGPEDYIRIEA